MPEKRAEKIVSIWQLNYGQAVGIANLQSLIATAIREAEKEATMRERTDIIHASYSEEERKQIEAIGFRAGIEAAAEFLETQVPHGAFHIGTLAEMVRAIAAQEPEK